LLQIARGLAAFWVEVTSNLETTSLEGNLSEALLPEISQILTRLSAFGDRSRQQIQGISQDLPGVLQLVPQLLARDTVWCWLCVGANTEQVPAWNKRAEVLKKELEDNANMKGTLQELQVSRVRVVDQRWC
jgi:hypothetical protein